MKMGKKVKEYKSGDFIFAKVKGYPAWPARVQRQNGKKYFVYFYGTAETANLAPNMIFDYAENKDKFLSKTVKRKDFNDGVRQIEHDFANNVPLEDVIGVPFEEAADTATNDATNDTTANDTMDTSAMDTIAADDTTVDDETATGANQTDGQIEDSDDAGALVIDEGKQKGKKSKVESKPPATPKGKETRGRPKKEGSKDDDKKEEEEMVSRSGRKIKPKRYLDEQAGENSTLPSPAPKKRRGGSPADKEDKELPEAKENTKPTKHYNVVTTIEIEDLKEPFTPDDPEKLTLLIAYLAQTSQYIGIKLFQSRPSSFKNDAARLQWDKQAAANALTLKMQLEKGQITPQSVITQLEMDLNLTDEEVATLENQKEIEEKRAKMQFLRTEMKLVELDAKIKTCLSLDKADTEQCLKLLDELSELEVRPLMLVKHPSCVETVKRMRAYIGNTASWRMSEADAQAFTKQAHAIRKRADHLYKQLKSLFTVPEGLSFQEYFTERSQQFTKASAKLGNNGMDLVHEPLEMSIPTPHLMKSAVDAANEEETNNEETEKKKKSTPAKSKKNNSSTPSKPPVKRQYSKKQQSEEKEEQKEKDSEKSDESKEAETEQMETDEREVAEETKECKDGETGEEESAKEAKDDTESIENNEHAESEKEKSESSKSDDSENVKKDSGVTAKKSQSKSDESENSKKESSVASKKSQSSKSDESENAKKDSGATPKKSQSSKSDESENPKKDSGVTPKKGQSSKSDESENAKKDSGVTPKKGQSSKSDESENPKKDSGVTPKKGQSSKSDESENAKKDSGVTPKKGQSSKSEESENAKKESGTTPKKSQSSKSDESENAKKDSGATPKKSQSSKSDESENAKKESGSAQKKSHKENHSRDSESGMEVDEEVKQAEKRHEKKEDVDEPRAKRSRETKKTDPPTPRSPAKRKAKP